MTILCKSHTTKQLKGSVDGLGHDFDVFRSQFNVDEKDTNGLSVLDYAVSECHVKVVEVLLDNNAEVNMPTVNGKTALHLAIVSVSRVLRLRMPVTYRTGDQERCIELLLSANADVDKQDRLKQTALHLATNHGLDKVVDILLKANANVDKQDHIGRTVLHVAVERGYEEIVE